MHEGHHGILDEEKLNPKAKSHQKSSKGEAGHSHHHHDDRKEQNGKIFATVAVMMFIFYVFYFGFIK